MRSKTAGEEQQLECRKITGLIVKTPAKDMGHGRHLDISRRHQDISSDHDTRRSSAAEQQEKLAADRQAADHVWGLKVPPALVASEKETHKR